MEDAQGRALRLAYVRELAASGEARRRRLQAHLSTPDVARVVGVAHTTIINWERATYLPRGDAAYRYGDFLDALAKASS